MRVGIGVDQHRFTPDRTLVLGGVEIPHDQGLAGHSDADALTHAICDALLGAAGMGDIGQHFPDSDDRYRDASSLTLLQHVKGMLAEAGWAIENLDAVVVTEAPKLSPYLDEMIETLAATLDTDASRLNLKATRAEGLGFVGRSEGLCAYAVAGLTSDGAESSG